MQDFLCVCEHIPLRPIFKAGNVKFGLEECTERVWLLNDDEYSKLFLGFEKVYGGSKSLFLII